MPPPPSLEQQSAWGDSTPVISRQLLVETATIEQLEDLIGVGANKTTSYSDGGSKEENKKEEEEEEVASKEKKEEGKINLERLSASSSSSNPRHEINDGPAAPAEPASELLIIVWWDEPEDSNPVENPMNWSSTKKWANILVISVISFLV